MGAIREEIGRMGKEKRPRRGPEASSMSNRRTIDAETAILPRCAGEDF